MKSSAFLIGAVFLLVVIGCESSGTKTPDPTPALSNEIEATGQSILSADNKLSTSPPAVPAARVDLKSAVVHNEAAKAQTLEVSKKFNDEADARMKAEARVKADDAEIAALNNAWFSPRQKHLFYWIIGLSVFFGILAAVGEVAPGWWSLPALWLMKGVRFVVFAGIPHITAFITFAFKHIVALFHKAPATPPVAPPAPPTVATAAA